ncbi:hypothetical protein [Pedobacter deserti]|uniref:hypothetical protein n=1 Tax=Pedobacter deserti TaxID=2817382 RepID=UPI002109AAB3|nr:hypothetical protein [Pedobacter sp. SYSU D00382]
MKLRLTLFLLVYALLAPALVHAQSAVVRYRGNLDKQLSLNVSNEPVVRVLEQMSKAGGFYFSYSGRLFRRDSLVSIQVNQMPVRDVLDRLFEGTVEYKEIAEHIILRYAANRLTIEPENIAQNESHYQISGYVVDAATGARLSKASVYEKRLLQSALTDEDGYFRLRFKGNHSNVILTASRENYRDTSLFFLADITVKPEGYRTEADESASFLNRIENLGLSRFFLSSKQKLQSLNIPDFLANMPFQASLIPGLSSHGSMSGQMINKGSLNVLGGYTAGVDGVEVGGLFNITKGDVNKVQVAGLFNGVGGSVRGVQVAGLINDVRTGVSGVQVAGLVNAVQKDMKGTQVAGLVNLTVKKLDGVQIAGLVNYATDVSGLQIGLLNISSRNEGYSIGLLNYVHHGYHRVCVSANETINANVALKLGNAKLYNILLAGKNFSDTAKVLSAGLGFGHDFIFGPRWSAAMELTSQYLYLGNWDYSNILNRFGLSAQYQVVKGLAVVAGPAYSVYVSNAPVGGAAKNYSQQVYPDRRHDFSSKVKGWLGWNVGLTLALEQI